MFSSSSVLTKQSQLWLGVCPHTLGFQLESTAFPSTPRSTGLQEKPWLCSKEVEPSSLQPSDAKCVGEDVASGACADKWCTLVMPVGRGERVLGAQKPCFWSCFASDPDLMLGMLTRIRSILSPPLTGILWVSCFVQRRVFPPPASFWN